MSKPDDIPQEVWDTAIGLSDACYRDFSPIGGARAISRAIMAERERCAKHADSYLVGLTDKGDEKSARRIVNDAVVGTAEGIGRAIRDGDPSPKPSSHTGA